MDVRIGGNTWFVPEDAKSLNEALNWLRGQLSGIKGDKDKTKEAREALYSAGYRDDPRG